MIDLHLHTTASDGQFTPAELVARASACRLTVMAVTDHDTTAAVAESRRLASAVGITLVPGIEISSVDEGRDTHVLGYFIDAADPSLAAILETQRRRRIARVEQIAERLRSLGLPVDMSPVIAAARRDPGRSIGRPQVALAMVEGGHVADIRSAFDRYLSPGCPAFIPREGPSPEAVIDVIHAAGGLASLAHPGRSSADTRIRELRDAGLDAVEVFHPSHDDLLVARYAALARDLGLLVTGGSDFHGDRGHGQAPGAVTLPAEAWMKLRAARPDA